MDRQIRSEKVSLFAQPLETKQRLLQQESKSLLVPGLAIASVMGISTMLLVARPNIAQNRPSGSHTTTASLTSANSVDTSAPARRDLKFYTESVRGNMFSAPTPAEVKKASRVKTAVKPVFVPPVYIPPPPPPLADWTYTGTVTMGEKKIALIENKTSKEGQYISAGESFQVPGTGMSAQVVSVTDQMVTLMVSGKTTMIAKSDTINITPLTNSAPYMTTPQAGQPGTAPPQPGAMGQMNMLMSGLPAEHGPALILPNGAVIPGNRAGRFNNRMNRKFNGGGGG